MLDSTSRRIGVGVGVVQWTRMVFDDRSLME